MTKIEFVEESTLRHFIQNWFVSKHSCTPFKSWGLIKSNSTKKMKSLAYLELSYMVTSLTVASKKSGTFFWGILSGFWVLLQSPGVMGNSARKEWEKFSMVMNDWYSFEACIFMTCCHFQKPQIHDGDTSNHTLLKIPKWAKWQKFHPQPWHWIP